MLEGNIRVVRSEIRRLLCDRDLPLETKDLQMHNGPESGFRCEARDKDLAKINCRLGLGSLSGQLEKVGIGRDSILPLSIKVARRVDMTGQFKRWNAESICFA